MFRRLNSRANTDNLRAIFGLEIKEIILPGLKKENTHNHTHSHTHALSGQSDVGSWVNFGYCGIKQTPCLGLGATVEIKERDI